MGNLPEPAGPESRPAAPAVRPSDAPTSVRDVAIGAGFERKGRWSVGRAFRGVAVIGNGEIDLRQARFIDGETTIHATAVVGDITVIVPEDADVHIGGNGILGGFDHHDEGPGTPGAPRITITGLALCGNVHVERRPADPDPADPEPERP
jgi:Cell wall-active antibiotics response 4TMS YvqF